MNCMRFKGNPGLSVNTRIKTSGNKKKLVEIGTFDENGILETDDPRFIERMKNNFPVEKDTSGEASPEAEEAYTCKKCGRIFTDKPEYMRHCKEEKKK